MTGRPTWQTKRRVVACPRPTSAVDGRNGASCARASTSLACIVPAVIFRWYMQERQRGPIWGAQLRWQASRHAACYSPLVLAPPPGDPLLRHICICSIWVAPKPAARPPAQLIGMSGSIPKRPVQAKVCRMPTDDHLMIKFNACPISSCNPICGPKMVKRPPPPL